MPAPTPSSKTPVHVVRIWDLPTRLFHWSLAAVVIGLLITGLNGGAAMVWHFRLGYVMLSLLMFRLVWGVLGGRWSRFSSFLYAPRALWSYLRGQGSAALHAGHNPLGALSVFALLLFLMAQVASGLVSDDEIASAGPLTAWVSAEWVSLATHYHRQIGKTILIALVLLHVAAILYHLVRKHDNLIRPMIHGDKVLQEALPPSRDDLRTRLWAALLGLICATAVWLLLRFAPG